MKVGYHKLDITPKKDVYMAGYNRPYQSNGILDPIEINTMIISYHEKLFILSILDSIIIEDSVIQPVKKKVCQKYHIHEQQIILGCIHTHSAPAFFKPFFEKTVVEEELQNQLVSQFINSIDHAMNSLCEVSLKIKHTLIEGLYGNRNKKNGYADKNLYIFEFKHKYSQLPFFSLISLACHPTILNQYNRLLSADLFGHIRLKYQQYFQQDCMIVNGCCGDVSTRFYRQLNGQDELERVSQLLLQQIIQAQDIHFEINDLRWKNYKKKYTYSGQDEFITHTITYLQQTIQDNNLKNNTSMEELFLRNLIFKKEKSPMTLSLYSHIIYLGDILIISLPGDITAIFEKQIRKAFPNKLVIILGYCENYSNYFVCEDDYGLYFETYISRLEKGNADHFIHHVIQTAKEL